MSGCANLPQWNNLLSFRTGQTFVAANQFLLEPAQDTIGQVQIVIASDEDTLPALARRYDLGYDEIVGANPEVDVWLPGEGTRIVLPTRYILPDANREGIVINVAARRLFYFPADDSNVVMTFPVGVGRDNWETPTGVATITEKITDPTWYPPASIRREHRAKGDPLPAIVPPGEDNPLGRHALILSLDGYLLHGTNKPAGVGMQVSHGCVRLYPEDIATIFPDMPVGTPVRIVDQPVLTGWDGKQLYLQTYLTEDEPTEAVAEKINQAIVAALKRRDSTQSNIRIDQTRTEQAIGPRRGLPVALTRSGPDINKVLRTAAVVRVSSSLQSPPTE